MSNSVTNRSSDKTRKTEQDGDQYTEKGIYISIVSSATGAVNKSGKGMVAGGARDWIIFG